MIYFEKQLNVTWEESVGRLCNQKEIRRQLLTLAGCRAPSRCLSLLLLRVQHFFFIFFFFNFSLFLLICCSRICLVLRALPRLTERLKNKYRARPPKIKSVLKGNKTQIIYLLFSFIYFILSFSLLSRSACRMNDQREIHWKHISEIVILEFYFD